MISKFSRKQFQKFDFCAFAPKGVKGISLESWKTGKLGLTFLFYVWGRNTWKGEA